MNNTADSIAKLAPDHKMPGTMSSPKGKNPTGRRQAAPVAAKNGSTQGGLDHPQTRLSCSSPISSQGMSCFRLFEEVGGGTSRPAMPETPHGAPIRRPCYGRENITLSRLLEEM